MRSTLPKLHRAGELTPVWVPDQAHEAIRDLVRARLAAVRTCAKPANSFPASFCGTAGTTSASLDADAPALAGRAAVRTTRCITSSSKTASRRLRRRRHGATVWKPISRRRCRTGRSHQSCTRCSHCAAGHWLRQRHWWPNSATSPASTIHASSWHILAWCRPSTPAVGRVPRRYHKGRQRGGAADADRGRLELSVPGPDQPRSS